MEHSYIRISEMLAEVEIAFNYEGFDVHVDSITICAFTPNDGFDFHMHSNYEFHYILRGKGTVILKDTEYELGPNSFYLTGPGVLHKQMADGKDPMVEYSFKGDIALNKDGSVQEGYAELEYAYILDVLNNGADEVVTDTNGMRQLFENIYLEIRSKRAGYYAQLKNLVVQLIIAAVRNFSREQPAEYQIPKRDLNLHRLELLQSYITDNLNRNITCRELAGQVFLSTRQLNRIVRDKTGLSVHDFILAFRLKKARELMEETGLKLSRIAEQTGFSSEFHLSSAFKKRTGLSPAAFRDKNRLLQQKKA